MLKLQYFGHLMWRADSLEKTLMLGKTEGKRRRGQQRMRWLIISLNQWSWIWQALGDSEGQRSLHRESNMTEQLNNNHQVIEKNPESGRSRIWWSTMSTMSVKVWEPSGAGWWGKWWAVGGGLGVPQEQKSLRKGPLLPAGLLSATSLHCHHNGPQGHLSVRITLLPTLRKNTWQIDPIPALQITPNKQKNVWGPWGIYREEKKASAS